MDVCILNRPSKSSQNCDVRRTSSFSDGGAPASAAESLSMEVELRHALERHQLEMHFQPQVSLKDGRVVGAEALMRWRHPVLGLVPPDLFIPIAECGGLIHALGAWAIHTVCVQMREWIAEGLEFRRVAVNLSPLQLAGNVLVDHVRECLALNGINGCMLELELTESCLLGDPEVACQTVHALKAMGVRISLDDFGTGFSSFGLLKQLPADKLKIDKSFVHGVTTHADDAAICRAVISLAHDLHMSVVVEGIETRAQMEHLRDAHADDMQGFYFSRPVSAVAYGRLLRARTPNALHTPQDMGEASC